MKEKVFVSVLPCTSRDLRFKQALAIRGPTSKKHFHSKKNLPCTTLNKKTCHTGAPTRVPPRWVGEGWRMLPPTPVWKECLVLGGNSYLLPNAQTSLWFGGSSYLLSHPNLKLVCFGVWVRPSFLPPNLKKSGKMFAVFLHCTAVLNCVRATHGLLADRAPVYRGCPCWDPLGCPLIPRQNGIRDKAPTLWLLLCCCNC